MLAEIALGIATGSLVIGAGSLIHARRACQVTRRRVAEIRAQNDATEQRIAEIHSQTPTC